MPDAKNMSVLDRDINTAVELLVAIAFNWPDADTSGLNNLSELGAPLAADIAWARRRAALGNQVPPPPSEPAHRRHLVNKALYEIFHAQISAPQVLYNYHSGEPELVPRITAELRVFYAAEPSPLVPPTIGRPRMYTAEEIANLTTNIVSRRRAARLKPREEV